MPFFPIAAFRIEIAPTGGFIQGTTPQGDFRHGPIKFDTIAAVAAVMNGPNPQYDPQARVFACSVTRGRSLDLDEPLAASFIEETKNIEPAY